MGQVIAFANNQVIVAGPGTTSTILTDPVPMNDSDQLTCHLNVDYIFSVGGSGLVYTAHVSMDGSTWIPCGVTDSANAIGTKILGPTTVPAAFVRFELKYTAGAVVGAVGFDLHVMIDHA